jgi:hypothetical protein
MLGYLRLSALVNLQTQPLKGIFPPSHQNFTVRFSFFYTRQPLCLKLHTNYQAAGPTCHPLLLPLSPFPTYPTFLFHSLRPPLPSFPTQAAGLQAAGLLPLPSRRLLCTGAEAAAALLPLSAERQGRRRRGGGAGDSRRPSLQSSPPPWIRAGASRRRSSSQPWIRGAPGESSGSGHGGGVGAESSPDTN